MTMTTGNGIDWTAVDGVIFDVDGTLFDHQAVRVPMLGQMLAAMLSGRMHLRDALTLRAFRRERERLALAEVGDIGRLQFERAAAASGRPPDEVEALVTRWMLQAPLAFVARHGFADAARFIAALGACGIRTGVFSDYPAHGKLDALGISVEVVRDAGEADVGRLKPCPDGFLRVAQLLEVEPARCLIIGDRDERDGEAARRGGFMFLHFVRSAANSRPRTFTHYGTLLDALTRSRPAPAR